MRKQKGQLGRNTTLSGIAFLIPSAVFIVYAILVPAIWNLILSFQKWDGFNQPKWVGLKNYVKCFTNSTMRTAMEHSLFFAVFMTVFSVLIGLIAALLIFRLGRREGAIYRLFIFLPSMLPTAIIGLLFTFLYNPEMGLVNQFLRLLGLDGLTRAWLSDLSVNKYAIGVVGIWRMAGLTMMLVYASLQSLPLTFFEAAKLDGANYWKQVILLILPLTKPIILLSTVYTLIINFKTYDLIFVMTRGGPGISTKTVPLYVMETGFGYNEFGYAAAIGFVLALVIYAIMGITNLVLGGEKYEY